MMITKILIIGVLVSLFFFILVGTISLFDIDVFSLHINSEVMAIPLIDDNPIEVGKNEKGNLVINESSIAVIIFTVGVLISKLIMHHTNWLEKKDKTNEDDKSKKKVNKNYKEKDTEIESEIESSRKSSTTSSSNDAFKEMMGYWEKRKDEEEHDESIKELKQQVEKNVSLLHDIIVRVSVLERLFEDHIRKRTVRQK